MGFFTSKEKIFDDWDVISTFLKSETLLQNRGELTPARRAGILYSIDNSNEILVNFSKEISSILYEGEGATKTSYEIKKDGEEMIWIILEDGNFTDLVSSTYTIGNAIGSNSDKNNLIAAIFELYLSVKIDENSSRKGVRSYCIYRYDRKAFYPFIPTGDNEGERDKAAESVLGKDLRDCGLIIEKDFSQWMGIWGIPF